MTGYGDYAAQIIHDQRLKDLQAELRQNRLVREAKGRKRAPEPEPERRIVPAEGCHPHPA